MIKTELLSLIVNINIYGVAGVVNCVSISPMAIYDDITEENHILNCVL